MRKYTLTNQAGQVELDIFEDIGMFGITAENIKADLDALGDFDQLTININSFGGDVFEGMAIFNLIRSVRQRTISNIIGLAGSISSVIALAADTVMIADNGFFMIHNVVGGAFTTAEGMRETADNIDKIQDQIINIYERKTGSGIQKVQDFMNAGSDNSGTMFNAQEAFDEGYVDVVTQGMRLAAKADPSDKKKLHNLYNQSKQSNMENSEELKKDVSDLKTFITESFEGLTNLFKKNEDGTDEAPADKPVNILDSEEVVKKFTALENKIEEGVKNATDKEAEIATLKEDVAAKEAKIAELEAIPVGESLEEGTPAPEGDNTNPVNWKDGKIGKDFSLRDINNLFIDKTK